MDLCLGRNGAHAVNTRLHDGRLAPGVGHEDVILDHVRSISQTILHVLGEHRTEFAAVLLPHAHLAILHHNTGLEREQVRAKGLESRATATLMKELKAVYNKGSIHAGRERLAGGGNGGRLFPCGGHLSRGDQQKAATGGKVAGIHHVHVRKALGRQPNVLIGGGHIRAEGKEDHRLARIGMRTEKVLCICKIDCGGLRQAAGFLIILINKVGVDIHPVSIVTVSEGNT